jgi:D-3-phosphoglycerate dehydrogenase / 2-oxoglutarate reductase
MNSKVKPYKGRVVALDAGYDSYDQEEQIFAGAGYHFEVYRGPGEDWQKKLAFAHDATGVLIRATLADERFFSSLSGLKALVRYGVGYDNVDLPAASQHKVLVANVRGYANDSVSDHALGLMYACNRGLFLTGADGSFGVPPMKRMPDFKDCTLGIIGLGRIGGQLAFKSIYLFDRVLAYDPYVSGCRFFRLAVRQVDLKTLLRESDIISLNCNLTAETRGLISAKELRCMSKKPILINTARGPIVDEAALLRALRSGRVRCAGIDVYSAEPLSGISLQVASHPHVLSTHHYAWYSEKALKELQRRAAENMVMLLDGRIPDDCLNPVLNDSYKG